MKTFMRSILIGVCILLGYGLVEASNRVSVDTIRAEGCYKSGVQIKSGIIDSAFSKMRCSDSLSIVKNTKYEVEYTDFRFVFTGDGVNGVETYTGFDSEIGVATDNLRDQFIRCTITYTRIISFHEVDLTDYDTEKGIKKEDLLGDSTGDYPKFELKSEREWHTVIRIKKAFSNERFAIEGTPCLVNGKTTLKVPDEFKDMDFQWTSIGFNDVLGDPTAYKTTVTRKNKKILETIVSCTVRDGCGDVRKDSIKLLPLQTPVSKLTFDDCLSTASKSIHVTASNELPDVRFQWNYKVISSDAFSQTVSYPVSGSDNFIIILTTTGGCVSSQTSDTVHRKLSDNVVLQELDSCLAAGTPFRMATEPPLPKMDLQWIVPNGFKISLLRLDGRKDVATITKNGVFGQAPIIRVKDNVCNGSIEKSISVLEAYTEMVVKDENGKILQNGDTVDVGVKKIMFIAPKHSSIEGENPYRWSITHYGTESFPLSSMFQGSAEYSASAPANGGYITVSVSYVSCRGRESESYTIYSR